MLEVEPAAMRASGKCACCGVVRRIAWGYVYSDGGPRACYFVEWVAKHGSSARFDVVVGAWSDDTTEADREAVSLEYRRLASGPSFALADARGRPAAEVGRARCASEVEGTALDAEARAIAGAVLAGDERLRDLRPEAEP
jgi:hypothetical protein